MVQRGLPLRLLFTGLLICMSGHALARPSTGEALTCPCLPPGPPVKRLHIKASRYNGTVGQGPQMQYLAFNGSRVGPVLRLTLNELVQIDVTNVDIAEGTTVHWHGQDLNNTSWADGVDGLTQRVIPVGATFSYRFRAAPAGTYMYHSHFSGQISDGLRGALIVTDPRDVLKRLYDKDCHVLVLADVLGVPGEERLRALQEGGMGGMGGSGNNGDGAADGSQQGPEAGGNMGSGGSNTGGGDGGMSGGGGGMGGGSGGMGGGSSDMGGGGSDMGGGGGDMGGGGTMQISPCPPPQLDLDISDAPIQAIEVNGQSFGTTGRATVVRVKRGLRYRLRIVGAMSNWALRLSVQGHKLLLVALDGFPVASTPVSSLVLTPGERADLVLHADQPVRNYWINVTTLDGFNMPAVLSYEGAPDPRTDPRVSATTYQRGSPCIPVMGFDGTHKSHLDLKDARLARGPGVPAPPKASNRAYTIYLTNSADYSSEAPPPPGFLQRAMQPNNIYGLPPAFASSLPASPADWPTCPTLPPKPQSQSKYCWSLNWHVFTTPADLPIYALNSTANASCSGGNDSSSADRMAAGMMQPSYGITVQQGDVVDLLLVNPSKMVHPMHLHGTHFWVLASGHGIVTTADDELNKTAVVQPNLSNPPYRDTVPVPQALDMPSAQQPSDDDSEGEAMSKPPRAYGYGYTWVRFVAFNPGAWAFHCHTELHASSGMVLYFTVMPKPGSGTFVPPGLACGDNSNSSSSSDDSVGGMGGM